MTQLDQFLLLTGAWYRQVVVDQGLPELLCGARFAFDQFTQAFAPSGTALIKGSRRGASTFSSCTGKPLVKS